MTALPPLWVISLAAARERRAFVTRGFAELGLPFELVDAVDGAALTPEQRRAYSHVRSLFHVGRGLAVGELACSLSHLDAYRRMVAARVPAVVIFEDDVKPTPALVRVLGETASFPADWDVVNLDPLFGTHGPTTVNQVLDDGVHRVCTYDRNPYGASCYLVRLAAAERLLDAGYPVCMLPDDLIFRRRPAGLRMYGIEPSVVAHGDFRSELVARGDAVSGSTVAKPMERALVLAGKAVHKTRAAWDRMTR